MNRDFLSQCKKEKGDNEQEEASTFSTDTYFKAARVGLGLGLERAVLGNRRTVAANGVRAGSLLFLSSMAIFDMMYYSVSTGSVSFLRYLLIWKRQTGCHDGWPRYSDWCWLVLAVVFVYLCRISLRSWGFLRWAQVLCCELRFKEPYCGLISIPWAKS